MDGCLPFPGLQGSGRLSKYARSSRAETEPAAGGILPEDIALKLDTVGLDDESESNFVYNMNHKHRGVALIINNQFFYPSSEMSSRYGSDRDVSSLRTVLTKMDFDVRVALNVNATNMMKELTKVSEMDHSDSDCFLCVAMSHGAEGLIYGTDRSIPIEDLMTPFKAANCPSLSGKPKLFFFQACRGTKLDDGVDVTDSEPPPEMEEAVDQTIRTIEPDFLFAYSVVRGYFSWRNSTDGSWFIQSLCRVLEKHGNEIEIIRLLTRVNHKVAYEYESFTPIRYMTQKKQIPCIASMLTKELYFKPKKYF